MTGFPWQPNWCSDIVFASQGRGPWFDSQPHQPETVLGIVVRKRPKNAGDDGSTLTLKSMGNVT